MVVTHHSLVLYVYFVSLIQVAILHLILCPCRRVLQKVSLLNKSYPVSATDRVLQSVSFSRPVLCLHSRSDCCRIRKSSLSLLLWLWILEVRPCCHRDAHGSVLRSCSVRVSGGGLTRTLFLGYEAPLDISGEARDVVEGV